MNIHPLLQQVCDEQPHPLLFATISGAHLYGFASPDSDYDLRGVHILPPAQVMGLMPLQETIEVSRPPSSPGDIDLDLVTHDVRKFMLMMLKRNGYVLEQLYSPLVARTTPEHEELKQLGRGCITRFHAMHYLGFAHTQWKLFVKETPPRVKPLLYVYRVLLTGIHLMRTGEVEANLVHLNREFSLPWIDDLIQRKTTGAEKGTLDNADLAFHQQQYDRLTAELEQTQQQTHLPESPSSRPGLHDLLLRLRRAADLSGGRSSC